MALRSARLSTLTALPALVLLAAGTVRCVAEPTDEPIGETSDPLTTPNGSDWQILPRPAARVSAVFSDAAVSPFVQSLTNATATPNTTTKIEGTTSLQVKLTATNSAISFGIDAAQQAYDGASQTELTFQLNAGSAVSAGLDQLAVAIDDDDAGTAPTYVTLKPYLTSGAIAANTWYGVRIPTSVLNPSGGVIRSVSFVNKSASANVSFFVDDVDLSWTDAAPTVKTIYTDSEQNGFTVKGWSITNALSDPFRTTGSFAVKSTWTGSYGALMAAYDWNKPEFPVGTFTAVSFDISGGAGAPPAALANMVVGLDTAPSVKLSKYLPGGFKANTWHHITIPVADLKPNATFRMLTLKNESGTLYTFYTDQMQFETDHTPPPLRSVINPPPPPPPGGDPDDFAAGEVDETTVIKTTEGRHAISQLIYGVNDVGTPTAAAWKAITFVRRGGDRGNTYNWENNVSNGGRNNNFGSDYYLTGNVANAQPAAVDMKLINAHRPNGRGVMVPFVLHDYVAGNPASNMPWQNGNWNPATYFKKVGLSKPTAFGATPDLNDSVSYTDEHFDYLRRQYAGDIYAPGAGQVIVGTDNEPDIYYENFPQLQAGNGAALTDSAGHVIGHRLTPDDFIAKFKTFSGRIKSLAPNSLLVGPAHYGFDGWAIWHNTALAQYKMTGHWFMDDFLDAVRLESQAQGKRLLDIWDFHWYPARTFSGTVVSQLDNSKRTMTAAEIDAVVQGPRSYWDTTYDEQSWITTDHLHAPTYLLGRIQERIDAHYPGTGIGVSEYFPGGCAHISGGMAVADSLGVFARTDTKLAAMWPLCSRMEFHWGGMQLMNNVDGNGAGFAKTYVSTTHADNAISSVYGGSDTSDKVTSLVVNKASGTRKFGIRTYNPTQLTKVDIYRIDAAHSTPYLVSTDTLTKNNAYAYAAPGMSATLLVFHN